MPFPNHHACRLREPEDFQQDSFRTMERHHEDKPYNVIMGMLKGDDMMTEQAYRYPKETWSVSEARSHCKEHKGILFEPAEGSTAMLYPICCGDVPSVTVRGNVVYPSGKWERLAEPPHNPLSSWHADTVTTAKYPRILQAFYGSPWAILPEKWEEIRSLLHMRSMGATRDEETLRTVAASRRAADVQMLGRVAVLPVFGVIAQRVSAMERSSGGISTEEIGAALDQVFAEKQVKAVVMAFDSPGGSVFGVNELADKIRGYRTAGKRIVAVADSVAASAAYWLASQASEVVVTPGGQVGSIGVIAAHVDVSKLEEMAGIKTTLVTSSRFKGEHAAEQPLSEEARGELQGKVDNYHGLFVRAVAKGRRVEAEVVESRFGQGRMLVAKDAVAHGLADRVATMEQVLADLSSSGGSTQARLASYRARAVEVG